MTKTLREFSSGGVVFKREGDKVLWLIRKTKASKEFPTEYWMLPKGWIDDAGPGVPGPMASGKIKADEESLQSSALREVREEGGIEAKIIKKIGSFTYFYKHPTHGNILKFVTFYLMEWERDLPNGHDEETSEVSWLEYNKATKQLSFGKEKEVIKSARILLN